MLLGGLWHGANWTFLAWGGLHGLILVVYRVVPGLGLDSQPHGTVARLSRTAHALLFFHLVCLTWVFFRADDIGHAFGMLTALGGPAGITEGFVLYATSMILFFVAPFFLYELWLEKRDDQLALLQTPWPVQAVMISYCLLMILVFSPVEPQVFIYFQF
jgi:D-alanyl-lipoteichoic acid acyltransferase DltB (MBOAT superfamily)